MDNEFLLREVHEEFAGRMEDEHRRINHRLGKVEETIGEINRLTLSVQSLAETAAVVPIISAISKRNMEKQALAEPQGLLET